MFSFEYKGGVAKPDLHQSEKFLLFFLVGDTEIALYQMLRDGLATRTQSGVDSFVTSYDVAKLFVSQQGFGIPKRYHSFYIRLDANSPKLEIRPYSPDKVDFYFRASSHIMDRQEVLSILSEKSDSRIFFERQETLALDLMNKMVHIDRSTLKAGVRQVQIKRKS